VFFQKLKKTFGFSGRKPGQKGGALRALRALPAFPGAGGYQIRNALESFSPHYYQRSA
jgi:hypothetical protein